MKEPDVKSKGKEQQDNNQHFKKKGSNKNRGMRQQSTADDFFRGMGFSVWRYGPELYLRTIERIGLYISTHFKIGSNVKMCLKQGKTIKTAYLDWQMSILRMKRESGISKWPK